MRFREDNPEDLARARTEVAAWRAQLFAADRHNARKVTGAAGPSRSEP